MRRNQPRFSTSFTSMILVIMTMIVIFIWKGSSTSSIQKSAHASVPSTEVRISQIHRSSVQIIPPSGEVVEEFFRTHPDEEVRIYLTESIAKGAIMLSWKDLGAPAAFALASDDRGQLVPVLVLTPELFVQKNRIRSQMIILHEYEHYKQWRDHVLPASVFVLRKVPEGDHTQLCNEKWHAERLAYHKECEFGRNHSLLDQLDRREGLFHLCRATEQTFEPTLKRLLMLGDPMKGVCSQTWDAL